MAFNLQAFHGSGYQISTSLLQNLAALRPGYAQTWRATSGALQSQGLSEAEAQGALLGTEVRAGSREVSSQVADSSANEIAATNNLSEQLQVGTSDIVGAINKGTLVNALGFAAVAAGLLAVRAEQKRTTAAVERVMEGVSDLNATLESMRIEQRWLLLSQTEAIKAIQELLLRSRSNECRQLVQQGETNYRNGYYSEALDRFLKALEYDNTDFFVYYHLGFLRLHFEETDAAGQCFRKASTFSKALSPELEAIAYTALSRWHSANGDHKDALSAMTIAVDKRPDDVSLHIQRIEMALNAGEWLLAEELAGKLIDERPEHFYTFGLAPAFLPHLNRFESLLQKKIETAVGAAKAQLEERALLGKRTDELRNIMDIEKPPSLPSDGALKKAVASRDYMSIILEYRTLNKAMNNWRIELKRTIDIEVFNAKRSYNELMEDAKAQHQQRVREIYGRKAKLELLTVLVCLLFGGIFMLFGIISLASDSVQYQGESSVAGIVAVIAGPMIAVIGIILTGLDKSSFGPWKSIRQELQEILKIDINKDALKYLSIRKEASRYHRLLEFVTENKL